MLNLARSHIQNAIDDVADDVEVKSLIVFVDPSAAVEFETEPEIPVLYADPKRSPNLKEYMRDAKRRLSDSAGEAKNASLMPLSDEQIQEFEEATI